jgi:hypothetical protein
MYIHPKLIQFTNELEALFQEVDEVLENHWGDTFPLHPNRPKRGVTSNPEMDGLFEIAPDFTVGLNSQKGRGYIVSLRVATLEKVPAEIYENFMQESAKLITERLPIHFPGREMQVVRDGKVFKIIGDFSLGSI